MQNKISRTHRANVALGLLLLGRDYAAKAWHRVFGPLVTECVEHVRAVRDTLNITAAATSKLGADFEVALSDGVVTPAEAEHLRRELAAINRRVVDDNLKN